MKSTKHSHESLTASFVHVLHELQCYFFLLQTSDADSDKQVRVHLVSVNGSSEKDVVDGRHPFKYFILQSDTGYLRLNLTDDNLPYLIGTHKLHIQVRSTTQCTC